MGGRGVSINLVFASSLASAEKRQGLANARRVAPPTGSHLRCEPPSPPLASLAGGRVGYVASSSPSPPPPGSPSPIPASAAAAGLHAAPSPRARRCQTWRGCVRRCRQNVRHRFAPCAAASNGAVACGGVPSAHWSRPFAANPASARRRCRSARPRGRRRRPEARSRRAATARQDRASLRTAARAATARPQAPLPPQ